jgi:succinoglycan biosynthesis protein ExoM
MRLEVQQTGELFNYSVVIVDNDRDESARQIVEHYAAQAKIVTKYYVEPEQNIALARNKAVENAEGDFIAFIDDDEFPDGDWLLNLFKAFHQYHADGVLGPVRPYFEIDPPPWIVKGKLCERESFQSGTILFDASQTRTGNVLISKQVFENEENYFDARFGKTGGEDCDFFRRMIRRGGLLVWCNEARVNEFVPAERLRRSYLVKRELLAGWAYANSRGSFFAIDVFKSVAACVLYALALPGLVLLRHDLFMICLTKGCWHLSRILAIFGAKVIKER